MSFTALMFDGLHGRKAKRSKKMAKKRSAGSTTCTLTLEKRKGMKFYIIRCGRKTLKVPLPFTSSNQPTKRRRAKRRSRR